jgi:hypothetical protein
MMAGKAQKRATAKKGKGRKTFEIEGVTAINTTDENRPIAMSRKRPTGLNFGIKTNSNSRIKKTSVIPPPGRYHHHMFIAPGSYHRVFSNRCQSSYLQEAA